MTTSTRLGAGEWRLECGRTLLSVRRSTVADGDFHIESDRHALLERRQQFFPGVWTQLDEVHGVDVKRVTEPGEFDFAVGDVLVTDIADAALSVWVGDCAAIAVVGDSGQFSLVHAGWRGALGGVVERSIEALRSMGADRCTAYLLSAIGSCCYEFGREELALMVDRFGTAVTASTTWGVPSLSMPAVVAAACTAGGSGFVDLSHCTHCSRSGNEPVWFSHRRGDRGRHVVAAKLVGAS